jgi:HPt (histidine-containing phosphotransfer) domain-containing protein
VAANDSHRPLNRVYMADIFEAGGEPLARDVVATFLEEAPRRVRALDAALEAADWGEVTQAAHALVSGSSMLGLTDVSESAQLCEHTAAQGLRPAPESVEHLHAAVTAARGVLEAEIARLVTAAGLSGGGTA